LLDSKEKDIDIQVTENQIVSALHDLIDFLTFECIDYALIGGLAVAVRGEPRSTLDIDVVTDSDVERALKLVKSLAASPFKPYFDGVENVIRTGLLLPLEHKQTEIRIDISLGMSGFDKESIANSSPSMIEGRLVKVVSPEYLVVMKQLAARPRDLDDIRGILIRQGEDFDWNLTLRLAKDLSAAINDDLVTPLMSLRNQHTDRRA
jgi:hypothetical protein